MEISAGIIFIKDDSVFLCHATNTPYWGIPKGHIEPGETRAETAIRECFEETSFIADERDLVDLGEHPYYKGKNLHLFLYTGKFMPVPALSVCTSYVEPHIGDFPENDAFEYVHFTRLKQMMSKSQYKLIKKVIENDY